MSKVVELTEEVAVAVNELVRLRATIKQYEDLKSQYEEVIYAVLGEGDTGTHNGATVIKVQGRDRVNVSAKTLEEKFPEVFEQVHTETHYTVLKTA